MPVLTARFAKALIAMGLSVATLALGVDVPSENNAAQLFLVVRDHSGERPEGVTAEDITVLDNGSPVKITGIEPPGKLPLRIGIILLSSGPSYKAPQDAAVRLLG